MYTIKQHLDVYGSQRNLSSSQFYSFAYCFYKQFRLREIALESENRAQYIYIHAGMHILMVMPFLLFINAAGARSASWWSFIVVNISSSYHY